MAKTARNAPCPCGSGRKSKRCCLPLARELEAEERRERRVGREAEEWAFACFGDELTAAGRRLTAELAGADQAAWISEHWVMLDYELRCGGTAAGRYAQLPDLGVADRELAVRIASSRPGVYRVMRSRPGEGMDLVDVLRGGEVTVTSHAVSAHAVAGDILVARVMDGRTASLWGPVGTFGQPRAGILLDEVGALAGQSLESTLRKNWPRLMICDTSGPRLIAHAAWDLEDPEAVFDRLPDALEYDGQEDGADVFLWRVGTGPDDYAGFFELYGDGLTAWASSQSLLDEAIALIDTALGSLVRFDERASLPVAASQRRAADRRHAA